jgi:hypothetical protein
VADGARTRDHRDHNPGLYQLSYRHRAPTIVSAVGTGQLAPGGISRSSLSTKPCPGAEIYGAAAVKVPRPAWTNTVSPPTSSP